MNQSNSIFFISLLCLMSIVGAGHLRLRAVVRCAGCGACGPGLPPTPSVAPLRLMGFFFF